MAKASYPRDMKLGGRFVVPGRAVVLALVMGVVGCGPSAGQVKQAKEARYQAEPNVVFKAAADAVASRYKIQNADAGAGVILTVARWYEKDGTFEDKAADGSQVMAEDGSVLLAFEVRVVGKPGPLQVQVVIHAKQIRSGYSALYELRQDDPAMPGWVTGKVDDLYVTIHDSLKGYQLSPPAAAGS